MGDATQLESEDLVVTMSEGDFVALLDIKTYGNRNRPRDYGDLIRIVLHEMNAFHVVAWGSPSMAVKTRITRRPLPAGLTPHMSMRARLVTTGDLCVAGYKSLNLCAKHANRSFPLPEDHAMRVDAGEYDVDVHRFFLDSQHDPLPDGDDHIIVVLTPAAPNTTGPSHTEVRWTPPREAVPRRFRISPTIASDKWERTAGAALDVAKKEGAADREGCSIQRFDASPAGDSYLNETKAKDVGGYDQETSSWGWHVGMGTPPDPRLPAFWPITHPITGERFTTYATIPESANTFVFSTQTGWELRGTYQGRGEWRWDDEALFANARKLDP